MNEKKQKEDPIPVIKIEEKGKVKKQKETQMKRIMKTEAANKGCDEFFGEKRSKIYRKDKRQIERY